MGPTCISHLALQRDIYITLSFSIVICCDENNSKSERKSSKETFVI